MGKQWYQHLHPTLQHHHNIHRRAPLTARLLGLRAIRQQARLTARRHHLMIQKKMIRNASLLKREKDLRKSNIELENGNLYLNIFCVKSMLTLNTCILLLDDNVKK